MSLELAAMRWLWLEKKCHYILEERCIRYWAGTPDVIGITAGRFMTEIEIKRSVSDFKADARKHHRACRVEYLHLQPKQFYYLIPFNLLEKIEPLVPEWAGLMTLKEKNDYGQPELRLVVHKKAPLNRDSRKLTLKECVKVTRYMTNHLMGYLERRSVQSNAFNFEDWIEPEFGTYQI